MLLDVVAFAYRDKLMISTFCSIAYSIPASILEIVPFPSFPIILMEIISASGFCSTILLTISSPCPFPFNESSINEIRLITFGDSRVPVSSRAIIFLLLITLVTFSASSASILIGLFTSVIAISLSSVNASWLAAMIGASGSAVNPASVYFTYAFIASSTVSY